MKPTRVALHISLGIAMIFGPATAYALGFVNNRAQWQSLSPEARLGYVEALNDSLNTTFVDDTLVNALGKKGRTECLVSGKITATKLSELMSIAYHNDRMANFSPSAVYIIKMSDICGEYINRIRQDYGLGPQ